jgi:hypothetical protein
MMRGMKPLFTIVLAAVFLCAAAYAGAQEKAPSQAPAAAPGAQKEAPLSKPYPMGTVTIQLKHVGVGVGVEWGKGVLTYKGKKYTFKVKGLQIATVGISTLTATGNVYNLFGISEFPGRYVATEASVALFKGAEGQAFKSGKDVHIFLKAKEKGVNLAIGPEGFDIDLEEAL